MHIAVDASTHEIITPELSLSAVTDREVPPNLLKQTRLSLLEMPSDEAYYTRACHAAIKIKGAITLIHSREGAAAFWERGHTKNLAMGCQKLYGSNKN